MKRIKTFSIYLVISCVFTFPLIFHLKDMLIGWPLDAYNYIWNIDTFWRQIFSLQNPFYTTRIFFPLGTPLIFHTYAPLISIIGLPFLKILPIYLNLLVITSPALSAFSIFLLIRHITKKDIPSFIAGFIYGFSPIVMSFLISQHYYFAFAAPIFPLTIYCLTKFYESFEIRHLIIACILFWVCLGIDYYSVVILAILIAVFSLSYLFFNVKKMWNCFKKYYKKIIFVVTIFLLIPSFFVVLTLKRSENSYLSQKSYYPYLCSTNAIRLIIPSRFNPFLKNVGADFERKFNMSINYDTPSLYLGIIELLLAGISILLYPPRKIVPFLILGIVILLFSLGPSTKIFTVFTTLPFLSLIDCPQRFIIGVQFSLAVLGGLAIAKIKHKKILLILIALSILFDYCNFNLPISKIEVPQIYKDLSLIKTNKTVLELPSGVADSKNAFGYDWSIQGLLLKQMYWQTISNKSRIGGYVSRLDTSYYEYFENEPIISDLFKMSSLNGVWDNKEFSDEEIDNFINKFDLGFIILAPNPRQEEFANVVEKTFGSRISNKSIEEYYILYKLN